MMTMFTVKNYVMRWLIRCSHLISSPSPHWLPYRWQRRYRSCNRAGTENVELCQLLIKIYHGSPLDLLSFSRNIRQNHHLVSGPLQHYNSANQYIRHLFTSFSQQRKGVEPFVHMFLHGDILLGIRLEAGFNIRATN